MSEQLISSDIVNNNTRITLNKAHNVDAIYPQVGNQLFDNKAQGERWLRDVINFPSALRRNGAILINALVLGERHMATKSQQSGEDIFEPPVAVFPGDYIALRLPPLAYYRGQQVMGLSLGFLKELALKEPDGWMTQRGGTHNELAFIGSPREYMTAIGIEERDHARFFAKHFDGAYPPVLHARDQRRVEYDAQPHEFSALIEVLLYAREHKFEKQEIALLERRIREARIYEFNPETFAAYQKQGYDLTALSQQERERSFQVVPELQK